MSLHTNHSDQNPPKQGGSSEQYGKRELLLAVLGASVEDVEVEPTGLVTIEFRHRGTDDDALRIVFNLDSADVWPWNVETGDFRAP